MKDQRGAVLLEALVALAILGSAAIALIGTMQQAIGSVRAAALSEREVREASGLLDAVALWPRADLDRHLGDHRNGPFRLVVIRDNPALYRVTVQDSIGRRELLVTRLYRGRDASGE